jgi:hypothetical protein
MTFKRIFYFFSGIALPFVFLSCQTVGTTGLFNEIQSEKIVVNTYPLTENYTVIGTAKGESDYVCYNSMKGNFDGDTGKYGYIFEREDSFIGDKVYIGTGKKSQKTEEEDKAALQRAKLNANYDLIEEAFKMGGDEILEPIYTAEIIKKSGSRLYYKVTVRAKVIKFNMK